jgi:S1-C subfamily serine protease
MHQKKHVFIPLLTTCAVYGNSSVSQSAGLQDPDKPVVLIRSVRQDFGYVTPWKRSHMTRGSGLIINGKKILTNAHNVSNYRYIKLAKKNVAQRYPALLTVDDASFFDGTTLLEPAGILKVNSTVSTYGSPVGGDRISVTEGIVSRIETDTYSHSVYGRHLVIQTDAAINPANVGDPFRVLVGIFLYPIILIGIMGCHCLSFFNEC